MTIVLGTDFSEYALAAGRVAGQLAKALGRPLHVVHVSEDPRAGLLIGTPEERLLAVERTKLRDTVNALASEFGVSASSELSAGPTVDALCEVAERHVADVLVIAAGSSAAVRLGRTAERVARNARVPVLAVRSPQRFDAWFNGAAPLRVLLGSDLGAAAREAEGLLSLLHQVGPLAVQVVYVAHPPSAHARYDLPPPADVNQLDAAAVQLVERDLRAEGEGLPWSDARTVKVIAGTSSADTHLSLFAEEADLVAVGARKRSWLEQAWYGSVGRAVLRSSPVSVLSVPRGLVAPKVSAPQRAQVVVVATDFSPLGDEAFVAALNLVRPGGTIHLVHVLAPAWYDNPEERAASRRQLVGRVATETRDQDIRTEILDGDTAEAIVACARRVGADTICLGSHGRSGLGALLLGSVSQRVLALAHVPVLVVPPPRE